MDHFDCQDNSIVEILFLSITKCIVSKYFLDNLAKTISELNLIQILLFDTCIEYMY